MTYFIRLLSEDDVEVFRKLRLEALQSHPEAFARDHDEIARQPLSYFKGQLKTNVIVGAGLEEECFQAIAGLAVPTDEKIRHKGILWGVYTQPNARGTGLAKAMLTALLEAVRENLEQVQITVAANNEAGTRLYKSLGFELFGLEKKALKLGTEYVDEIHMALHFQK